MKSSMVEKKLLRKKHLVIFYFIYIKPIQAKSKMAFIRRLSAPLRARHTHTHTPCWLQGQRGVQCPALAQVGMRTGGDGEPTSGLKVSGRPR